MPEDTNGTPLPEDQSSNPGNQEDNIPDWMKEAGWGKDSGAFDESKPVFDTSENEDEIVPADIPAWLEDAVPDGFTADPDATPAFEGFSEEGSFITTGDLMPRTPSEESSPTQESVPSESAPSEPDPAEEQVNEKSEPELDIPSWLKNLELDEDSQETAVAWLENMPEDLRATDEEIEASKRSDPKPAVPIEPESIENPVDELAWIDEIAKETEKGKTQDDLTQAELSEDLVASELIPEQGIEDQIFGQEEIQSMETEAPDWLQDLAEEKTQQPAQQDAEISEPHPTPPIQQDREDDINMMPDWLSDLASDEPEPPAAPEFAAESEPEEAPEEDIDIPDWLGEFESSAETESETTSDLDWLDNLAGKDAAPTNEPQFESSQADTLSQETADTTPEGASNDDGDVSPLDETLNTQVPDWLSKIGEFDSGEEESGEVAKSGFDESASWLDQIDKPIEDGSDPDEAVTDGEVMDWLENMEEKPEEVSSINDLRESFSEDHGIDYSVQKPVELESAKYFKQESEDSSDSMPDWLSEINGDDPDDSSSLESAIRQSDHSLSDEEKEFLDQVEEKKDENADWLAKLDLTEEETKHEPASPATRVELPDNKPPQETTETAVSADPDLSGGILDRLNGPSEEAEPEVPQWLEDLKKEEDPQDTAILWLKQFVERGNEANLNDEIKRYTDELNPGDAVPKWMDDLKHEEDPQTTAMLWLEKLAGQGPPPEKPKPPKDEIEDGWLAELEKEAEEQTKDEPEQPPKDFQDASDGWLADLEIDEKLQSEEADLPDWSSESSENVPESETPLWMKATSPLEGDFHTDELAGNVEKEVEIPAWLAGYGEGEEPAEETPLSTPEPSERSTDKDEYTWVSETETPAPQKSSKEPIDLNKAAISQLESILGISYQVAQGIVIFREKQGPYRELKDLLNVPEITDKQTIEILKPEVFIKLEKEKPKPKPAKKTAAKDDSIEERIKLAEALLAETQIPEALEHYDFLIKKKKYLPKVIENLIQAAADNPVNISILKTLGDAYMRDDKLDEALAAYTKAEELLH